MSIKQLKKLPVYDSAGDTTPPGAPQMGPGGEYNTGMYGAGGKGKKKKMPPKKPKPKVALSKKAGTLQMGALGSLNVIPQASGK